MNPEEEALVAALALVAPSIGKWISGLIDHNDPNPTLTKRVRDILPSKSASQAAVDELRGFDMDAPLESTEDK